MKDTPLKAPFKQLLSDFLDPIIPDSVALSVLQAATDDKTRAQELAPLIRLDPDYRQYLFAQTFLSERMSEWIAETEGKPNRDEILLERILGLLGKGPIRNLIACAQVARIQGLASSLKEDEKVASTPTQIIPFALEAERTCQDNGWHSHGTAFLAGLHYDWLAAVLKTRADSPSAADDKTALASAFKEGISIAKTAYEIGQRAKDIHLGEFLFSAGLLLPIGKALMACLFPKSGGARSWFEFNRKCAEMGDLALGFQHLVEHRRFPTTYTELSSLFASFGTTLSELEKALYFASNPAQLKEVDHDQFQLATLLSVAERATLAGDKKTRYEEPQLQWMKKNGVDGEILKTAVMAARKAK